MSKTYQAILFDLDGTLIDTAGDFIAVLNQMRSAAHLPLLEEHAIRAVVSDGARAMIKLAFGIEENDPKFASIRQQFLDLYLENIANHSHLFPGLEQLLAWCQAQQIPWGIVTNKPRLYSEALLEKLNLAHLGTLVCPDDVKHAKPHPEPMLKACAQLGITPEQCLYVGDHVRDIDAGKNANMPTIAAGYGYVHTADSALSWQADWTVQSSIDLHKLAVTLLRKPI